MLHHLHISNYALIDQLDISFEQGFSVITGETGAGKSIILGALGLLLGQRADTRAILSGANKCIVEAVFRIDDLSLASLFAEAEIEYDENECILRRELTATGKSRAFVNDELVSLQTLKSIASALIDIHSQHQNLLLSREDFLLETLDQMSKDSENILTVYQATYSAWKQSEQELERLLQQAEKDNSNIDFLQYQIQQLDEANLVEGEQEMLEAESEQLEHAEEIKQALYTAAEKLSSEESGDLIQNLRISSHALDGISSVFPDATNLAERLESARVEIQDIVDELNHTLMNVEFDPDRFQFVTDRLDLIYTLQKKHHAEDIAALLKLSAEYHTQLETIENIDEHISQQKDLASRLYIRLLEEGKQLRLLRETASRELEKQLTEILQELGMPHVRLQLAFTETATPTSNGLDKITFLFSANKNAPLQDAAQIASGGEVARLMLALKATLSQKLQSPTIIFDEIDTGVSGTMAERMANIMKKMATACQVITITHLPQIAATGATHYRVYKADTLHHTRTHIEQLTLEERIEEIANMLSGEKLTNAAINNAKSLLKLT